jgi:ABC-type branched-subunit amino acid transport system substrate-binding protein
MFAVLPTIRKPLAWLWVAIVAGLSACAPGPSPQVGPISGARDAVQVALLVPDGSERAGDALYAEALENAARMAMADLQGVTVDLRVYPTAGQETQAASQALRAVDDGAQVILGPLYALETNAAGLAIGAKGVPVLSFSNNAQVAGGNVFVLGPTFANTANRLMAFAAAQGKSRIAIVFDDNQSGQLARRAIEQAARNAGVSVVTANGYALSQQGIIEAVPGIAQAILATQADAVIFTADTAAALPLVSQLLADKGIDPAVIQYMGLSRWDVPATAISLPALQNGWFARPDPTLFAEFSARYSEIHADAPLPLAGLAYDGIAAIGALVRARGTGALQPKGLAQGSGFLGVNGVFRLLPDGTNERALAIAKINNNQVIEIDPAPRYFANTGF